MIRGPSPPAEHVKTGLICVGARASLRWQIFYFKEVSFDALRECLYISRADVFTDLVDSRATAGILIALGLANLLRTS